MFNSCFSSRFSCSLSSCCGHKDGDSCSCSTGNGAPVHPSVPRLSVSLFLLWCLTVILLLQLLFVLTEQRRRIFPTSCLKRWDSPAVRLQWSWTSSCCMLGAVVLFSACVQVGGDQWVLRRPHIQKEEEKKEDGGRSIAAEQVRRHTHTHCDLQGRSLDHFKTLERRKGEYSKL